VRVRQSESEKVSESKLVRATESDSEGESV
jgi:hypothetical protein